MKTSNLKLLPIFTSIRIFLETFLSSSNDDGTITNMSIYERPSRGIAAD